MSRADADNARASDSDPRTYELFGLTLESQLSLPDAVAVPWRPPDVLVRRATAATPVDSSLLDPGFAEDWFACHRLPDGSMHLRWSKLFDFWISADGRLIEYRRHERATLESFAVYLLGQVLSFSLLARGIESLHGSVVVVHGQAIALLGDCGAGKSTLAAAMLARGFPLMTDDLVVLQPSRDGWTVQPGMPRLKLFPSIARNVLGAGRRGAPMNTGTTKLVLPLGHEQVVRVPVPLKALYVLGTPGERGHRGASGIRIEALDGAEAFLAIVRGAFNVVITDRERLASQFAFASRLASTVRVRRVTYPRRLARLSAVCAALIDDLAT